ncbi:hypothetical protein AWB69_09252 [Caballeronia udeis]|uniref:Uncharacterized protein n=1 Tax=Caballeronia udeis TaxID=1232866 RepID=A0A158K192_9BURK|nr:hypothetical protein AWB69_09252 [Caballeronia udeis]
MPALVVLPWLTSLIVTLPSTTPATVADAVAAAVWFTVTFVVTDVPVTVTAPPVTVLPKPAAPLRLAAILTVVPPVTLITSAVRTPVCEDASFAVTTTAPVGAVVVPTLMVPPLVTLLAVTVTDEPPCTDSVAPDAAASTSVIAVVFAAVSAEPPTSETFNAVRPAKPSVVVTVLAAVGSPEIKFSV